MSTWLLERLVSRLAVFVAYVVRVGRMLAMQRVRYVGRRLDSGRLYGASAGVKVSAVPDVAVRCLKAVRSVLLATIDPGATMLGLALSVPSRMQMFTIETARRQGMNLGIWFRFALTAIALSIVGFLAFSFKGVSAYDV